MIQHAWHFYYALVLVIKVACGVRAMIYEITAIAYKRLL
ncbi:TPA: DUF3265 domain-containing protein [Vibrio harveyi]|nr:DUF3265 domain-containing protein [Vibrio harveyi]